MCRHGQKSHVQRQKFKTAFKETEKIHIVQCTMLYAKLPYMNLILLEGEKLNLRLQI